MLKKSQDTPLTMDEIQFTVLVVMCGELCWQNRCLPHTPTTESLAKRQLQSHDQKRISSVKKQRGHPKERLRTIDKVMETKWTNNCNNHQKGFTDQSQTGEI